jgi:chitinase
VDLIETYSFDGIDIDWEYPGYAPNGGTPADEANYTLLLQAVRNALDNHSALTGETYLLTTAMPAGISNMNNIDWTAVSEILDFMNVMTYDFFGTWDPTCNHNSPLYAPAQGDPSFNCSSAIETLINNFGVDPSKLNLGIPFYGRSFKTNGTPALFAPVLNGSADSNTFWADEGTPLYYNVLLNQNLFTTHWDDDAQVPYLTGNGNLNTFVSYDDTTSVGLKAQYVVNQNLRGVIIWEITGDYIETSPGSGVISSTPLADMIESVFCNGYTPDIEGCTNPDADNYNAAATVDNGSCIVPGCMYPQAENYNPVATYDDLSCAFSGSTCASDLNDDGFVNITDLLIFISDFGSVCP